MNIREWFPLLKKSFSEWQDDKALKLGAYARKYGYGVAPADYAEPLEESGGLRKEVKKGERQEAAQPGGNVNVPPEGNVQGGRC